MSGSNSGDPPDESGDIDREQRDRSAGASQPPPAAEEPSRNDSDPDPRSVSDSDADTVTIEDDGVLRWFLNTDDETVMMARDVLSSVAIVAAVGLLLFAISGIWPPLVAVESGSMEPNMHTGDLIFVVDDDRFVGDGAVAGTGVVTHESGQESGYDTFNNPGDVIVYQPNGDASEVPVIHRAHFWVEDGENWVDTKASEEVIGDATCAEVTTCPAEYDGFVTKGDANNGYDQYGNGISDVVKPEWVTGKAKYRIPWLGNVRLTFDKLLGGMIVPTSPSSQPLQDPTAATVTPTGADAPGFGGDGDLAGVAGLASVGAGAAVAVGRSRR